jgi:hypothetical protein
VAVQPLFADFGKVPLPVTHQSENQPFTDVSLDFEEVTHTNQLSKT